MPRQQMTMHSRAKTLRRGELQDRVHVFAVEKWHPHFDATAQLRQRRHGLPSQILLNKHATHLVDHVPCGIHPGKRFFHGCTRGTAKRFRQFGYE